MGFFRCCVVFVCTLPFFLCPLMAYGGDTILAPSSHYPSGFPESRLRELVGEQNFRLAIGVIDEWLLNSKKGSCTPFLLVEKAKILYANQQHTEAQEVFLKALAAVPSSPQAPMCDEEKKAFDGLFSSYEACTQSPEGFSQLLEQAQALLKAHPEFASLEHYVAACYANQGEFIQFFDRFFHAFQSRPDCFLCFKTIGVLHLRLFEASSSEERREAHRQEAVRYLKQAFSRQPHDSTVLAKLAFILPRQEKVVLLQSVIADLLSLQTPIRRGDCFFLIQQAIDVGEVVIAKQLLEKARSWYQYSRALDELSNQLPE